MFFLCNLFSLPDEVANLLSLCYCSQNDDSGFATMEKEPLGSLTPMLGDKKVSL
jgi:hypothetical protein